MKMKSRYYKNYFKSIENGLNLSLYKINSIDVNPFKFFNDIKFLLKKIRTEKNKIFLFGNGASASFANHMALDFSKNGNILSKSLSDNAMLSALSNDFSYEEAMVEFLKIEKVDSHDLIITISSSGNSSNIINVLNYCKLNKIKTFSLSGLKKDNKSINISDYSIYVPMKTYGIVECIHQIFLHLILDESMGIKEWDKKDYQNMNSKYYNL